MREQITGLILAGGRGSRMGGLDKGLVLLDGQPMIDHAIRCLRPQVADIVISANRHLERYAQFGYRVVADTAPDFAGPLAGIASASATVSTDYFLTVPCDAPLLAGDLAVRLAADAARTGSAVVVAHDGKRVQPLFMLIAQRLAPEIEAFVARGGRTVEEWLATQRHAACRIREMDTFTSVDVPEDRQAVERKLRDRRLGHVSVAKKQSTLARAFQEWRARKDSNLRPPGS